jgi:hypothetical protein
VPLDIRGLEAEDRGRGLVGLEYRLKWCDRVKERVAEDRRVKGRTVDEALRNLTDAIRYTFQYPDQRYAAGVRADVARLTAHGFTEVGLRNCWSSDQFKGISSCWREPESGQLFEVQFHTRPSFEAMQITHAAYMRLRVRGTCDAERTELRAFIGAVYTAVPVPPGADRIKHRSRDRRDG